MHRNALLVQSLRRRGGRGSMWRAAWAAIGVAFGVPARPARFGPKEARR
jgi:hypothetical protein